MIFEIVWNKPTGFFSSDEPKYSAYPFEKEVIVTDGKKLLVKEVKLQNV